MLYCKCGNVTFLTAKKVPKEGAPFGNPRRPAIRHPKMFRFSGVYQKQISKLLSGRCSKIGTFLDTGWRCGGWGT